MILHVFFCDYVDLCGVFKTRSRIMQLRHVFAEIIVTFHQYSYHFIILYSIALDTSITAHRCLLSNT